MTLRALPLAAPALFCALCAVGCAGDNSGCGSPPKAEGQQGSPTYSGNRSPGRAETVTFADPKGQVPNAYRRKPGEANASRAPKALGKAAAGGPASARIVRRQVDGAPEKVEVFCPLPLPPPGKCLEGPHFSEMKEICCPDGLIERCFEGPTGGLHIIGRGCGPGRPRD